MKHDINTDVLKYYVYLVVQLATDVAYTSYMAHWHLLLLMAAYAAI